MSTKKTTKSSALDAQLKMSLKEVLAMSKADYDQIQIERKIESSKFASEAGLVNIKQQLSEKEWAVKDIERSSASVQSEILQNRMEGYDFQKELQLFTRSKETEMKLEQAREEFEYYQSVYNHMEAVHKQLFG